MTGGAGFIGGAGGRRVLSKNKAMVFNLDKGGYASDCSGIEATLQGLGSEASDRYRFMRVDLADGEATAAALREADPDPVMHLGREPCRSIDRRPGCVFVQQCDRYVFVARGGESPLERSPSGAPAGFPVSSHQHR